MNKNLLNKNHERAPQGPSKRLFWPSSEWPKTFRGPKFLALSDRVYRFLGDFQKVVQIQMELGMFCCMTQSKADK